jgi:hypothetical protein
MKTLIQTFDQLRDEGFFADYAIGGGVATLFYTEPFATVDVDVFALIPVQGGLYDLSPIYSRLQELGFRAEGQYILVGEQPVQLMVPPSELEEDALREATWHDVDDTRVRVFRAEHLLAIYLRIGRAKDLLKIQALLNQAKLDRTLLSEIITRHQLEVLWNDFQKKNS